jgi:hypothetical protein
MPWFAERNGISESLHSHTKASKRPVYVPIVTVTRGLSTESESMGNSLGDEWKNGGPRFWRGFRWKFLCVGGEQRQFSLALRGSPTLLCLWGFWELGNSHLTLTFDTPDFNTSLLRVDKPMCSRIYLLLVYLHD